MSANTATPQLVVKDTENGGLELTDGFSTAIISKDTVEILKSVNLAIYNKRQNWKLTADGYVACNFDAIHRIIGDTISESDALKFWDLHYKSLAAKARKPDMLVVGHLDNNRLNFNIGNLQKIPQTLNSLSRKTEPKQTNKVSFFGAAAYDYQKKYTKSVSTDAEARHATDILKLEIVPVYFREYLFTHAMHRPEAYLARYESVENLMSYGIDYTKKTYAKQAPRESKNRYIAYRTVDEAQKEMPPGKFAVVKALLGTPGVIPFDPSVDAIIHYIGAISAEHVFICDYVFYSENVEQTKPSMTDNQNGYLKLTTKVGLQFVHNMVLGRCVNQTQEDGLVGGHGAAKVLDNRLRVLKELTRSENNSDKLDSTKQTAPGFTGVVKSSHSSNWTARISGFFKRGKTIHLGCYKNMHLAGAAFQFATDNKKALKTACKGMDSEARDKHVRACVKSRKLI